MVFNGILKLMPSRSRILYKVFCIKEFIGKNTRYLILNTRYRKSFGFTLIELLVVITLFGIVSTLITASYTTFERNQRIRNATQTLKNDLRLVQNKALAGDKGVSNVSGGDCTDFAKCCPNSYETSPGVFDTFSLVGWYVTLNTAQTSTYTYKGVCKNNRNGNETTFNPKTVTYPSGVALNTDGIKIGGNPQGGIVNILFKPLVTDVALYDDPDGVPPFTSPKTFSGDLVIELKGSQTSNLSTVTVRTTGEISGD